MRIQFSNINFCENVKMFSQGENKVVQHYYDNNNLRKCFILDKFNRDIDAKHYDEAGNLIFHMHKEYSDNDLIETFKDKFQEYTRTIHTEIKNSMTHTIEKFHSKTSPEKNYVNEFIHDMSGQLVKFINNGKVILLKK